MLPAVIEIARQARNQAGRAITSRDSDAGDGFRVRKPFCRGGVQAGSGALCPARIPSDSAGG